MAVTVPTANSDGAKTTREIKSQNKQKTDPNKNDPGMSTIGFDVFISIRMMCGTAIPTKEIGPANATTVAESMLDNTMIAILVKRIFVPIERAYPSPNWYAPIGFDRKNVARNAGNTITDMTITFSQPVTAKLPKFHVNRSSISSSSAKTMRRSVNAPHM